MTTEKEIKLSFPKDKQAHIILIGMPFSGKTTIASILSVFMERNFLDSDDLIEKHENKTINQIFDEKGEKYFRKIEAEIINDIIVSNFPSIISIGGGAFENENTRKISTSLGFTVWIKPSIDILYERLKIRGAETRPLFKDKDPKKVLTTLEKKREKNYMMSHIIIDIKEETRPQDIAHLVYETYKDWLNGNLKVKEISK